MFYYSFSIFRYHDILVLGSLIISFFFRFQKLQKSCQENLVWYWSELCLTYPLKLLEIYIELLQLLWYCWLSWNQIDFSLLKILKLESTFSYHLSVFGVSTCIGSVRLSMIITVTKCWKPKAEWAKFYRDNSLYECKGSFAKICVSLLIIKLYYFILLIFSMVSWNVTFYASLSSIFGWIIHIYLYTHVIRMYVYQYVSSMSSYITI